jgi:hypothetical protein
MTFIAPNIVSDKKLSLGGAKFFLSPTVTTNKASLPSDFRNMGMIDKDTASSLNMVMEKLEWKTGTPSKTVYEAIINQAINFTTELSEIDIFSLELAFGAKPTYTLSGGDSAVAASPAPTTTTFDVALATDFAVGDLVEVNLGTGGTADKHYRRIKSISDTSITLDEALPEAPAENDTVKEVSETEWALGSNTTPEHYTLKLEKVFPILNKKLTIVLYKVSMANSVDMSWQDDSKNIIPVQFSAMADSDVDSGNLGFAKLAANT